MIAYVDDLTSMLIKTPARALFLLPKARKSDNVMKFPAFVNRGFRISTYFSSGSDIAAAGNKRIANFLYIILHDQEKNFTIFS